MRTARRFLPLFLIAAAVAAFFALGLHRAVSLEAFAQQRAALDAFASAHPGASVLLFALIFYVGVTFCLPMSAVLTVVGGYLFGLWLAAPLVVAVMTAAAATTFYVTRTGLGDILRTRAGTLLDRFEHGFQDGGFNYILAMRIVPVAPFTVVTLAAGLLEAKPRDFLLATLIGVVPPTLVYGTLGESLHGAFAQGIAPDEALRTFLFSPQVIVATLALTTLALAPRVLRSPR